MRSDETISAAIAVYDDLWSRAPAGDVDTGFAAEYDGGRRRLIVRRQAEPWLLSTETATEAGAVLSAGRVVDDDAIVEWLKVFPDAVLASLDRRTAPQSGGKRRRAADKRAQRRP